MVLSPQTERPRNPVGLDQSTRTEKFRELSWAQFDHLIQALAARVSKSFKPDVVVGIAHGGVFVGGALAAALGCDFHPVRITRRSRDKNVRGTPKLSGKMPESLQKKKVLLSDDIVSSGDTLELARQLALQAGASQVKSACLIARAGGLAPDWSVVETDELFVFPWDYQTVAEDERFDVDPDKAGA